MAALTSTVYLIDTQPAQTNGIVGKGSTESSCAAACSIKVFDTRAAASSVNSLFATPTTVDSRNRHDALVVNTFFPSRTMDIWSTFLLRDTVGTIKDTLELALLAGLCHGNGSLQKNSTPRRNQKHLFVDYVKITDFLTLTCNWDLPRLLIPSIPCLLSSFIRLSSSNLHGTLRIVRPLLPTNLGINRSLYFWVVSHGELKSTVDHISGLSEQRCRHPLQVCTQRTRSHRSSCSKILLNSSYESLSSERTFMLIK